MCACIRGLKLFVNEFLSRDYSDPYKTITMNKPETWMSFQEREVQTKSQQNKDVPSPEGRKDWIIKLLKEGYGLTKHIPNSWNKIHG